MVYGYLRVSTSEQNEARQLDAMLDLGIAKKNLYLDKCSGRNFERPAWTRLVKKLKKGDLLVVKCIDRLGRNYEEIIAVWQHVIKEVGADIQVLDMPLLNTQSRDGDLTRTFIADLVLQILSYVAETERTMIRKRQTEGIAAAKARGVQFGHPWSPLPDSFEEGLAMYIARIVTVTEAARIAQMPRSTFYRRAMLYIKTK